MYQKIHTSKYVRIAIALLLLIGLIATATPVRAGASTLYVKWNAGGANNGMSWANAYTSLQSALAAAPSGSEIWVAAGTYKPTSGADRTISFSLKSGVKLYGGFAGTETLLNQRDADVNLTILSGDIGVASDASDNSLHVVRMENVNNTAVLDGFAIQDGNANVSDVQFEISDRGGGIYSSSSSPILANLVIENNTALNFGGGMYAYQSNPALVNVLFLLNHSDNLGGGMYNEGGSSPSLTNVTFTYNTARYAGGGMENLGHSNPSLTDVAFLSNSTGGRGGGMSNAHSSQPVMTRVTFKNNFSTSGSGGGMSNSLSNPTLNDVIFLGNDADDFGGGMLNLSSNPVLNGVIFNDNFAVSGGAMENQNSSPVLKNVTFSANIAASEGGGMRNLEGSTPHLTNVTFWANTAYAAAGMLNASSHPILENVTFSSNEARFAGGGLANVSSNPIITNVILWGDSAPTSAEIYNVTSSPVVTYSIVQGGYTGVGNLDEDPLLSPLQDNGGFTKTMALEEGSPAIDAGDDSHCPDIDQRGVSRPQSSHCDIGAYERAPTFADVPFDYWSWSYIEGLYNAGVTSGCGSGNYCPGTPVTRDQMAVFLLKGKHGSSYSPPAPSGVFGDVPTNHWAAAWIEQLADEGITAGCGSGNYCPATPVTRDQMAVFLLKAKHGSSYNPPTASGVFGDVPVNHWAAAWIEQLAAEGITGGCGSGNYCPAAPVTRDQMAVFLVRTFNLPLP